MAAKKTDVAAQCRSIVEDVRKGIFRPVYLLMGDEPYYPDLICREILAGCVDESFKDFNEMVWYGSDVDVNTVMAAATRFPMMAERQLVLIKDAQDLSGIEKLEAYCSHPLESTVLVLLLRNSRLDARKSLYKTILKQGVVVDSQPLRDYEAPAWITSHCRSRGLDIRPEAASLLAEYAGCSLESLSMEIDKIVRSIPEGTTSITDKDVENNVGVSRQFSIFELTRELSARNAGKALTIAARIGASSKYPMPGAVSALFMHFNRILRYSALLSRGGHPGAEEKAAALAGVNPYFYREYDTAVRNYPLPKLTAIISLLCEYDYLGKGGDGGAASQGDLLVELTAKILSV